MLRAACLCALLLLASAAEAHRLAPALLELVESADGRVALRWKQTLVQPRGAELRPELPSGCEPTGPARLERDAGSATLVSELRCPEGLVGQRVGVTGLAQAGSDALLRVELADGRSFRAVLSADRSRLRVPERQGKGAVFADYLQLGLRHILAGLDHLLLVLGLVLLALGRRRLLLAITAFTLGHSLTLCGVVLGRLSVPPALAELAIAATLLVLALEVVPGARASRLRRRPWEMAALFGLIHGLGFAGALVEIGLPQEEIPLALLSFNLGIEAGQLGVVAALAALGVAWAPLRPRSPSWLLRLPAYAIGSLAVFWCLKRGADLL